MGVTDTRQERKEDELRALAQRARLERSGGGGGRDGSTTAYPPPPPVVGGGVVMIAGIAALLFLWTF